MRCLLLPAALVVLPSWAWADIDCSPSGPFGPDIVQQPALTLCALARDQERDIFLLSKILTERHASAENATCAKPQAAVATAPLAASDPRPSPRKNADATRKNADVAHKSADATRKRLVQRVAWKPSYCHVQGMSRYPECK